MSRSITIGGTERADLTRLETFSFQESAYRGEVGHGGFDVDSEGGAVSVSAWKDVIAIDSDGGQFFTGQTVDRGVGRGPFSADSDARWDVQVIDINTIMDDILLRSSEWNRPEETDVERMQALIAYLNAQGYAIDDTYLLTTAPEDMDAQDYRKQGVLPRSVADECAENSGKNWYLFWDTDIDSIGIWYGRETSSLRESAYGISSVLDDIDDYGLTWPAEWPEESGLQRDPSRVYSAVQVVYGTTPNSVYVDRPATETAFKRRETVLYDASVKTETKATKLANHYLDYAESEDDTITVAVTVPTTHVNAFQAGQRIACRFPHLGYDTPTFMRCRQRTVEPAGGESKAPDRYHVTLVLKPSVKVTRFGGRPANDVPGQGDGVDGGTATPTEPAELEIVTGACASVGGRSWLRRFKTPNEPEDEAVLGGLIMIYTGSYVANNEAWSVTACPIGGGGWNGYEDRESWFEFTAPADDPDYLGLYVTVDATGAWQSGSPGGYHIGIAAGSIAEGRFGLHTHIAGGILGGIITAYVPRSHVAWGATNSIILAPDWNCARSFFTCNSSGYFGSPLDDGRGGSGAYYQITPTTACPVKWADATEGPTDHGVAAYGDIDGVNRTFTLIGWDGTGTPTLSRNGLDESLLDATFNRSTGTVTLPWTPTGPDENGAGADVLLWTYMVGSLSGTITLTPDPVAFVIIAPEVTILQPIVLYPDPVAFVISIPTPTVTST